VAAANGGDILAVSRPKRELSALDAEPLVPPARLTSCAVRSLTVRGVASDAIHSLLGARNIGATPPMLTNMSFGIDDRAGCGS
jgi:hypothetical protein